MQKSLLRQLSIGMVVHLAWCGAGGSIACAEDGSRLASVCGSVRDAAREVLGKLAFVVCVDLGIVASA
jgi:hypothetical protein